MDQNPSDDTVATAAEGQSVLPDDIRESIALGSFCGIAGQPSSLSNLAYSNAIHNNNLTQQNTLANQQAMNQAAQAALGSTVSLVANVNPMEAVAITKMDTGNDVASQLMDLKAAIAGGPTSGPSRPKPVQPLNPQPNPAGGVVTTASVADFPITIVLDDNIVSVLPLQQPIGGTLLNVNSGRFPVQIRLKDSKQTKVGAIANVSASRFPFIVNLESGSDEASKQNTPSTLTVSKDKFPVQINLTR